MSAATRDALQFRNEHRALVDPYLPPRDASAPSTPDGIHVTLTFATSLDSSIALEPGRQTALSGPESKALTHYLRSCHDAILVGVGTAIADDPSLNCRLEGVGGYGGEGLDGQPRPIVLDPEGKWNFNEDSKVLKLARQDRGKGPWVIRKDAPEEERDQLLKKCGGKHIRTAWTDGPAGSTKFLWKDLLDECHQHGIKSIMIEGGARIINDLLHPDNFALVDSVIVTIAPTWLGQGGVQVCPEARIEGGVKVPVGRLENTQWIPLGEDAVVCGKPKK